jgi:hypothetical protein
MQDKLLEITRWITRQSPLFLAEKNPISDNPFSLEMPPIDSDYDGNMRLGFIYQELCKRLFESHHEFDISAQEIQLFDEKKTIGAIDFLLERQNKIEHWEVAIKFYLLKDGLWYGPDSRDRLDKKLDRMLTHQLKMSETDAFKDRFPEIGRVEKKLFIQGRLYTNPFSPEPIPNECLGYEIQHENILGHWCYSHQVELIEDPIFQLDKIDWITGKIPNHRRYKANLDYSVHCQTQSGTFWFVVPDTWPHLG